jgi:hypothetical protein
LPACLLRVQRRAFDIEKGGITPTVILCGPPRHGGMKLLSVRGEWLDGVLVPGSGVKPEALPNRRTI